MYASNVIVLNTEMGCDAEIILSDDYSYGTVLALVQQGDTLSLMRAYPSVDPTDTLLPESIIEAAAEYSRNGNPLFKVWTAGKLSINANGDVALGKQVVGVSDAGDIKLYALKDLIKRAFH